MLKRTESTTARPMGDRRLSNENSRKWCWNEWIYGSHVRETWMKKKKRLGEYFVKTASSYPGVPADYRRDVWKILLGISEEILAKEYMRLLKLGRCHVYEKIKCDTFRTLATDKKFKSAVSEDQLTRVLNAFAQKAKESKPLLECENRHVLKNVWPHIN
jgi:hypothetical protein